MWTIGTCDNIEAGLVEGAHEQLESDDGVDDDDEEDEEGDVHQGDDRHQDGIHHNLQTWKKNQVWIFDPRDKFLTWHAGDQSEGAQNPESSKGLHVKTLNL